MAKPQSLVLWIDGARAAEGSAGVPIDTSGDQWSLRGIDAQDRTRLLKTVKQGFKQGAHRIKLVGIEQGAHALPQQTFAAQLGPDGLKQGTTELLGLVHQERQHHQHGKHDRKMLLAMSVVMLKVIALVFQRIEGLVFDLPPRPSTP